MGAGRGNVAGFDPYEVGAIAEFGMGCGPWQGGAAAVLALSCDPLGCGAEAVIALSCDPGGCEASATAAGASDPREAGDAGVLVVGINALKFGAEEALAVG